MHKLCKAGCDNYVRRAFFPEKSPLIMKNQLEICKSDSFGVECTLHDEGVKYHELRRIMKEGCPFLSNTQCGKPNSFWCKGHVPPFLITNKEDMEMCLKPEFKECPNYKMGMDFIEETNRIKSLKTKEN